jgi:hypothetical protein
MSARPIDGSERRIAEVKWGNAALWNKSFSLFYKYSYGICIKILQTPRQFSGLAEM